ncbi:MAG: DUF1501 domain-containing protein [Isosphaeraceae bacterium]
MFWIDREYGSPGNRQFSRRAILCAGGLSALGLAGPELVRLRAATTAGGGESRHRGNSCVFIFLFGGPSHIDLWDMKPKAPLEIRGEFRPVDTSVPGIQICEHLPMLAATMDRVCLVRSMTHQMPVHGPACSELYSGRPYFGAPVTDQARPEDWPSIASMVARFGQGQGGWPPSIVLPWFTQFAGQDRPIAGQFGGRMGAIHRPFLVEGDPSSPDFQVPGVRLPAGLALERVRARGGLLRSLDGAAEPGLLPPRQDEIVSANQATAQAMLGDAQALRAFELDREPRRVRERYGEGKFAQSLLLARRLVEAGVSLVTVNYDDESASDKVSPYWDTHHQNFPKLRERLAPRFDRAYSAFLEDLHQRGLLDTTLVVATGEFGRSPRVGQFVQNNMTEKTGRDHWPHAFTVLLAGGGVRGGQVYGATNAIGSHVADRPVTPADLAATILHHLGVDHRLEYWDEFQQVPRRLSEGKPIADLA